MTASTTDKSGKLERQSREQQVARLYADILGLESVDVDADFFALGGTSLGAMQLLASLNEAFGSELQFGDLVDKATPRAVVSSIESSREQEASPAVEGPDGQETPHITRGQLMFWRLARRKELASYFNLRQAILLHGPLDIEALHAALQALVDRHESLRMHFRPKENATPEDVELVIPERLAVAFSVIEAPADARSDPPTFVRKLLQEELDQPFDLLSEPLIRFRVARFTPTLNAFLVTMHHLITDAWSFNVLRRELNQLYRARVRGQPDSLPPLPMSYSDHARANRRLHATEPYRREQSYWENLFTSLRPFDEALLSDKENRGQRSGTAYADLSMSDADVARIAQRSAAHHTTPYVLLQALMHLTLYSLFETRDRLLVVSPANDRHRPELVDSIGLHITIVGVVSALSAGMTLRDFIAELKRSVHEAVEHYESRQLGLYDLAKHRAGDFPLFVYNYFVLQNDCAWAFDDLRIEPVFPAQEDPRTFVTMLELYHARGPSGLWGQLKYDLARVDDASAERFIANYRSISEAVLSGTRDDLPVTGLIGR